MREEYRWIQRCLQNGSNHWHWGRLYASVKTWPYMRIHNTDTDIKSSAHSRTLHQPRQVGNTCGSLLRRPGAKQQQPKPTSSTKWTCKPSDKLATNRLSWQQLQIGVLDLKEGEANNGSQEGTTISGGHGSANPLTLSSCLSTRGCP